MDHDTRYNGWANKETWLVNLWLTNEEASEASCREIAREAVVSERPRVKQAAGEPMEVFRTRFDNARGMIAGEAIKERWAEPLNDTAGVSEGLLRDLVTAALERVDWREIGKAFLKE